MILKSAKALKQAQKVQIFGGKAQKRVIYEVNWHAIFDGDTHWYAKLTNFVGTACTQIFRQTMLDLLEIVGTW